jgi:hypothetical protein
VAVAVLLVAKVLVAAAQVVELLSVVLVLVEQLVKVIVVAQVLAVTRLAVVVVAQRHQVETHQGVKVVRAVLVTAHILHGLLQHLVVQVGLMLVAVVVVAEQVEL